MPDAKPISSYISQLQAHRTTATTFVLDHPVSTALILTGTATIVLPLALGFTTSGPAAGTVAAAWQSSLGNVPAHSTFAALQSATMKRSLLIVGGSLVGAGVVGAVTDMDRRAVEWMRGAQGKGWEEVVRGVEWGRVVREAERGAVRVKEEMERRGWGEGVEWVKGEAVRGAGWIREEVERRGPEWRERAGWVRGEVEKVREEVERRGPEWMERAGWAAEAAKKGFGRVFEERKGSS